VFLFKLSQSWENYFLEKEFVVSGSWTRISCPNPNMLEKFPGIVFGKTGCEHNAVNRYFLGKV